MQNTNLIFFLKKHKNPLFLSQSHHCPHCPHCPHCNISYRLSSSCPFIQTPHFRRIMRIIFPDDSARPVTTRRPHNSGKTPPDKNYSIFPNFNIIKVRGLLILRVSDNPSVFAIRKRSFFEMVPRSSFRLRCRKAFTGGIYELLAFGIDGDPHGFFYGSLMRKFTPSVCLEADFQLFAFGFLCVSEAHVRQIKRVLFITFVEFLYFYVCNVLFDNVRMLCSDMTK